MRLLVLADERPREHPAALVARNDPAALVTLGDLRPEWLASPEPVRIPSFGVHGNHDVEGQLDAMGIEDLHMRRLEVGGWTFAGFEGCVRYRPGPFQYTQEEAERLARHLPAADVLVCHCPPFGINDEPDDRAHMGLKALRAWIDRHRPRYVLHGHTTPDPRTRVFRSGGTEIVWVRGARVIELER